MPGESTALAAVYLQEADWKAAKAVVLENNLLQTRTESTARRKLRELIPRLAAMTHDQLQLIVGGSISEQRQPRSPCECYERQNLSILKASFSQR